MKAWHFVGDKLLDGRPIPKNGIWLEHDGSLKMCEIGLHASVDPFDALQYAPGPVLCRVDVGGTIVKDEDKLVCSRRRIVKGRNIEKLLRQFACECALDVAHMWDMPPVVKEYLTTRDQSIRAASWAAAHPVTRATMTAGATSGAASWAAWAASWAASEGAGAVAKAATCASWASWAAVGEVWLATGARAGATAKAKQRKRFNAMVRRAFK